MLFIGRLEVASLIRERKNSRALEEARERAISSEKSRIGELEVPFRKKLKRWHLSFQVCSKATQAWGKDLVLSRIKLQHWLDGLMKKVFISWEMNQKNRLVKIPKTNSVTFCSHRSNSHNASIAKIGCNFVMQKNCSWKSRGRLLNAFSSTSCSRNTRAACHNSAKNQIETLKTTWTDGASVASWKVKNGFHPVVNALMKD